MDETIKKQEIVEAEWSQMDKVKNYPINSPRWLAMIDFAGEQWKEIKGYEGKYLISCFGRVKHTGTLFNPPHILKVHSRKIRSSYWRVDLYYKGKTITRVLHRYVAEAFIPNPDNLPFVNHKDENKLNPCASNLEWCTQKYNSNYGTFPERMRQKKLNGDNYKPVHQYTLDGEYVASYPSVKQACMAVGLKGNSISGACNSDKRTSAGYIWSHTKNEDEIKRKVENINRIAFEKSVKKVQQLSLDGRFIQAYPSIYAAAKINHFHGGNISRCARGEKKTYKGYKWIFA